MLPFGVTIPAAVLQGSEIPEGLMNNPVDVSPTVHWSLNSNYYSTWSAFKLIVPLNAFTIYLPPRPAGGEEY
jgi:hypothetical protein